ncbi:MAG: nucleotide exchange factor GrpE [Mycoplasma sp.]|nr:nucleotide exchange factor GrpE [Mycoplasma sp.]
MNNSNKWIIEENDILNFDLKIKKKDDLSDNVLKIKNKTITIGKEEIMPGIDNSLIGMDLSVEKTFEIKTKLSDSTRIFENLIDEGEYIFSFRCLNLQKDSTKEILETSTNKEVRDDKEKISQLEQEKEKLLSKIEKLEIEKELNEKIFKTKAEEMAKNAAEKVEKLKEEIKEKAKEEIQHKAKFSTQKLLEELLNPINNLYIAIESGSNVDNPSVSAYVKGFQMIINQIFSTLESNGINIIEPKIGDEFNPEVHYAQELIEDSTQGKDKIVKVISRGYKLHDRVIKPAIVVVSK